ncbi:MAG: amidohydrolase [Muribaculaceae bacterium]|nr:amidohydrolase [Muribaculaceae bacterium]
MQSASFPAANSLHPLMKVLDERGAVVILHPVKPDPVNESTFTGGPIFVYEYPAETTRAVLNMVAHNVMTRYPDIKVVVPHAGSFMPYAVPRLKGGPGILSETMRLNYLKLKNSYGN